MQAARGRASIVFFNSFLAMQVADAGMGLALFLEGRTNIKDMIESGLQFCQKIEKGKACIEGGSISVSELQDCDAYEIIRSEDESKALLKEVPQAEQTLEKILLGLENTNAAPSKSEINSAMEFFSKASKPFITKASEALSTFEPF